MKIWRRKRIKCPNCKIKMNFCMEGEFYWCPGCKYEIDSLKILKERHEKK